MEIKHYLSLGIVQGYMMSEHLEDGPSADLDVLLLCSSIMTLFSAHVSRKSYQ